MAAQLPNVLMLWLIALAVAHAAKLLGASNRRSAVVALAFVLSPVIWRSLVHTAYTDGLVAFAILSAVTFGLMHKRIDLRHWQTGPLLAGVSLGLAAGTKYSAVLPAAAIALILVVTATKKWWTFGAVAGGGLLFSGLWFARNWVIAGNPIFPSPVSLFGHTLFTGLSGLEWPYRAYDASVVSDIFGASGAPLEHWLAFAVYVGGFSVAITLVALITGSGKDKTAVTLRIAVGLCLLAYAVTPQSASALDAMLNSNLRYGIPAFAISAVLISKLKSERLYFALLSGSLILGAAVDFGQLHDWSASLSIVAVAAGAVMALAVWLGQNKIRVRFPRPLQVALGLVATLVAAGLLQVTSTAPAASLTEKLAAARPGQPVVAFDVQDTTALLGPNLDVKLVAPGAGPQGALRPILSGPELVQAIEAEHPAAVVIGDDGLFNIYPADFHVPADWRQVGTVAGATVYVTENR